MPEVIDVTGLPEPVVRDIRRLVETLRETRAIPAPPSSPPQPVALPLWEGVVVRPWKRRELYEDVD